MEENSVINTLLGALGGVATAVLGSNLWQHYFKSKTDISNNESKQSEAYNKLKLESEMNQVTLKLKEEIVEIKKKHSLEIQSVT